MISKTDLKKIAEIRLEEAKALCDAGFYDGAVYLCGYVVEAALKAVVCKHLKMPNYLDTGDMKNIFLSHDFNRLLLLSGLQNQINLANKKNTQLFKNWSMVTGWSPDIRYSPVGSSDETYARSIIKALEEKGDGFLTWIKKKW